jgi:hypothetical protein
MEFEAYLEALPNLHSWDGGKNWNTGGFGKEHLAPLRQFLIDQQVSRIVETGAGNSTITFLLSRPAEVLSIAPDADLFGRIEAFCSGQGIPLAPWRKITGPSQWELPRIATERKGQFDFALLDGCHGWPIVFIDYFYTNAMVRPGGYLMLDDVGLHSIAELVRFLKEQPGHEVALDLGKAIVFKRTIRDGNWSEWNSQPYIKRLSGRRPGLLERLRARLST